MRTTLLSVGLCLIASLAACHAPHGARGHGRPVVIQRGHSHTATCGHYRVGKKWHEVHGHTHRTGCGHHFTGGVWIRL